jgi:hypothetical protein
LLCESKELHFYVVLENTFESTKSDIVVHVPKLPFESTKSDIVVHVPKLPFESTKSDIVVHVPTNVTFHHDVKI